MFKKSVIFVSVILLSLAFVDIAFGDNQDISDAKSSFSLDTQQIELIIYTDIYEAPVNLNGLTEPNAKAPVDTMYIDSDNDGLTDNDEYKFGTDPFVADTDNDYIIDSIEVKSGTNPNYWDTDGDRLADYIEIEYISKEGGTNPFESDSDHDGLPDPWEDNDGDTILNIEEQDPKFKYGILGTNPNMVDSDGDTVRDDHEAQVNGPGPISLNAADIGKRVQQSVTSDRNNTALDVSNTGSDLSKHLKDLGWSDSDLSYWDWGLEQAVKHGVLPTWANTSCTVWYHYSPLIQVMPDSYNWNAGAPYWWNYYDTNPAVNDTDGDVMDDDWDPQPLIYDDRLDSYLAINNIKYKDVNYPALGPTNGNFTGAFKANFSSLEMKKGERLTLTLWLGLEDTPSNDPIKISQMWWKPINISIWFGSFQLGPDNLTHGTGANDIRGDDIWPDINNTNLPSLPDKPWLKVDDTNDVGSYTYKNSTGVTSTMYFYEQIISIYLPADLPAGIIGFILRANPNTGENLRYETYTWPFVGY